MSLNSILPLDLQEMVNRELEPGERIVWMDMPIPRFFTPVSTGAFLFGIPWTAFALFWTAGAAWGVSHSDPGTGLFRLFPLFGVPFILVGLGMLSSPLWAYRRAKHSVYVITDRRAITLTGIRSTTIRSYSPEQLHTIHRREKRDGTGDVYFERRTWKDSEGDSRSEDIGFLRIHNPREIERMLKALAARQPFNA